MGKEKESKKNYFHVRIYNAETLKMIEELYSTGRFDCVNEMLGYAIGFGIEKLYLEYGKKKVLSQTIYPAELPQEERLKKLDRQVAEMKVMLEDIFIMQNCQEGLISTLYNVQHATVKGEPVSTELMDSGFMADLPSYFASVKKSLEGRFSRKLENTRK